MADAGKGWYQHQNTIQGGRSLVATLHGSADAINANAALMVAAHELLEAARAVANELASDGSGGFYLSARDYFDAPAAVAALNAAIAKASA